jgi:CubicO group peptidase (beta-lactamase class C family)
MTRWSFARALDRSGSVSAVVAAALMAACSGGSGEGAAADAGGGAVADAAVDGGDPIVAVVDGIMEPAISADALDDLDRCVGAVAVVVTPERSLVLGYGATEAGGTTRPDGDTLFQIGSVSKVYTGLGLARLVASGELAADDPAAAYLAADLQTPLAGTTFTLVDLATHHAGFPEMPSNLIDRDGDGVPDPGADPLSPGTGYSRDHLRTFLEGFTPEPGAPFQYSNVGVGLLGIALEDHLGAGGYDAVIASLVTGDLGMTSTWGELGAVDAAALARLAQGYAVQGDGRVIGHPGQMGVLAGAGEILTTGDDLALLLEALAGIRSTALDEAIALAVVPVASTGVADTEMGYAIEVEHVAGGDLFHKGGNTSSYTTYLVFRRDPRVGVAVMTSCGRFMATTELALRIHEEVTALVR